MRSRRGRQRSPRLPKLDRGAREQAQGHPAAEGEQEAPGSREQKEGLLGGRVLGELGRGRGLGDGVRRALQRGRGRALGARPAAARSLELHGPGLARGAWRSSPGIGPRSWDRGLGHGQRVDDDRQQARSDLRERGAVVMGDAMDLPRAPELDHELELEAPGAREHHRGEREGDLAFEGLAEVGVDAILEPVLPRALEGAPPSCARPRPRPRPQVRARGTARVRGWGRSSPLGSSRFRWARRRSSPRPGHDDELDRAQARGFAEGSASR